MRPDNAEVPTEDELKAVQPFPNLPECLLPTLRSSPPHLEYGFPISDAQLVAFARRYRPNDTVAREPLDPTNGPTRRTLRGASKYLSAEIGCRVDFRDVWNAAPEDGGGYVMSFCDNYHARTRSQVVMREHAGASMSFVSVCDSGSRADAYECAEKLAELLELPPGALPKWYINGVEYEWGIYAPRSDGH
ncbi:hypothetical protein EVG20_g8330 [Dentipellis fragilis]|uniref:Uncharacterized protein n=1 Tax=Dentipellis fragilis TaxID=205917 RepID=A0A4Y9Y8U5_9AGAM|nr:hypothetical protein EVG20_g8330 [Dentipellis fragilis]